MKTLHIVLAAALIALSAPAFAQSEGQSGATGASGPLTGHNPPGSAGHTSSRMGATHHHHHSQANH